MMITFGNQKGGAGKSTLAILMANYLSLIKNEKVVVLDLDYQKSIYTKYEECKLLDQKSLYEVIDISLEDFEDVYYKLKNLEDVIIIIDLPGKLDDENLLRVLMNTDIFVIPFCYDKLTYQSTTFFSLVLNKINPKSVKYYVPNRIKTSVKYEIKELVDKEFSEYGIVTKQIKDLVSFQRLSTLELESGLIDMIELVFNPIVESIICQKKV